MSIYIGPGVLDLSGLKEDGGHQHVQLGHQLEQRVVREVLQGELPLASVPGVGLTKDSVTVARDDLARLEKAPNKVLHLVIGGTQANTLDNLLKEDEHLLVGEAVKRSGEAAHASTE